jgi:hypothetical protein
MELIRTKHKAKAKIIHTQTLWGGCAGCRWVHQTFYVKGSESDKSRAMQLLIDEHDNRNTCASRISFSEQNFSIR